MKGLASTASGHLAVAVGRADRPRPARWPARIAVCVGLLVSGAMAGAQETQPAQPAEAPTERLTLAVIEERLAAVEGLADSDEERKAALREQYQEAQTLLERETELQSIQARNLDAAEKAPDRITELRNALAAGTAIDQLTPPPPDGATLEELQQALSMRQQSWQEAQEELVRINGLLAERPTRRSAISGDLETARKDLAEAESQLLAVATSEDPVPVRLARRTLWTARRQEAQARIAALDAEASMIDAEAELLQQQKQRETRRETALRDRVRILQNRVDEQRKRDVREEARRIRAEVGTVSPPLRPLKAANAELAEQRATLADEMRELTLKDQSVQNELARIQEDSARTEKRVESGTTTEVGLLLRRQRSDLPPVRPKRQSVAMRQRALRDVQALLFEYEDELQDLNATRDSIIEAELLRAVREQPGADTDELEPEVTAVVDERISLLDRYVTDLNGHFVRMVDLNSKEQELILAIEEYGKFIDEHVFWVRSAEVLSWKHLKQLQPSLLELLDTQLWNRVARRFVRDGIENGGASIAFFLVFGTLLAYQRKFRLTITELGQQAIRPGFHRFLITVRTLLLTVAISLPWPLLAFVLGWRLEHSVEQGPFSYALASGLTALAVVWFPLEFLRQCCRPMGLGNGHFGWSLRPTRLVQSSLRWLLILGLPFLFVAAALNASDDPEALNSLGRVCFLILMLMTTVAVRRLLHPRAPLIQQWLVRHPGGWIDRLKYVWYGLSMLLPFALGLLAAAGYFFSAWQIAARVNFSIQIVVGLWILAALMSRWLLVTRRRLTLEQMKERQESMGDAVAVGADEAVDLTAVTLQTRKMVRSTLLFVAVLSLWPIWVDALPALERLRDVRVWATVDSDGSERIISVVDLATAILVLTMGIVAARNIPGFIELSILQRLPLDSSVRYAITSLTRYAIVIAGVLFGCAQLGLTWDKAQWLVAALGVGLGFGLQEIFANFVSGIILLFERPIRVGDVITLGDTTGTVTRIRIRATTLTNWDRRELIVPNRELITGRLLNWTLTDQINRVVINVGVAYGSDTAKTSQLIFEAANENPHILEDPPPRVTFELFGESSLQFVLRAFLASMDYRLDTIHALHSNIDRKLRDAGIEIAFPQRDLHIRSIDAPLPQAERPSHLGSGDPVAAREHPAERATGETAEPTTGGNGHETPEVKKKGDPATLDTPAGPATE